MQAKVAIQQVEQTEMMTLLQQNPKHLKKLIQLVSVVVDLEAFLEEFAWLGSCILSCCDLPHHSSYNAETNTRNKFEVSRLKILPNTQYNINTYHFDPHSAQFACFFCCFFLTLLFLSLFPRWSTSRTLKIRCQYPFSCCHLP